MLLRTNMPKNDEMAEEERSNGNWEDANQAILVYRQQLNDLIKLYQEENIITIFDANLLLLRLGLGDKRCFTLIETGEALHMSSENIRRRQYVILRKKIHDPLFFHVLKAYSQFVCLPRGIQKTVWRVDTINEKDINIP